MNLEFLALYHEILDPEFADGQRVISPRMSSFLSEHGLSENDDLVVTPIDVTINLQAMCL